MNRDQLEGKWKEFKQSAQDRWGKLTDEDLAVIAGKRDQLIRKIQERYGITREMAAFHVDFWTRKLN
jgi:uncharacterized protein YjbJ (UPF0337 family)